MPDTPSSTGKPMPYYEVRFWEGIDGTVYADDPRGGRYPLSVGYEQLIRRFGGMELEMLAESARADYAEILFTGQRPPTRPDGQFEKDILARFANTPYAFEIA
jgi:hypothetical protein